jgi:GWxTD domain-containing protein
MQWTRMKHLAVAVAFAALAVPAAEAALSQKHTDWATGPAQWIMTADEKKAWRAVRTDEEAVRFIDLFWVRRDPTPGTPQNEYRDEFEGRVQYADANFRERNRRGSLTDRGRVYVVLGNPTRGENEAGSMTGGVTAGDGTGSNSGLGRNQQLGTRIVWEWDFHDAQKFEMPKIEVIFIQDSTTGRTTRDVQRRDFLAAEPVAIRNALRNPDIKELPSWAPKGGLNPVIEVTVPVDSGPARVTTRTETAANIPATEPVAVVPTPVAVAGPLGASRLVLVRNVYDIDTETKNDPFATLTEVEAFTAADELGWAALYCGVSEDPMLRFTLRITGRTASEVVDRAAPPDEMVPDRVKATPGCYMLRGAIPLQGMNSGTYQLNLTVEDTTTPGQHTLARDFRIE